MRDVLQFAVRRYREVVCYQSRQVFLSALHFVESLLCYRERCGSALLSVLACSWPSVPDCRKGSFGAPPPHSVLVCGASCATQYALGDKELSDNPRDRSANFSRPVGPRG